MTDTVEPTPQPSQPIPTPAGPSPTEDIVKHGGALSGAVVGGVAGSFIPIVGTIGGAIVGAVVGHLHDEKRHSQKKAQSVFDTAKKRPF